MISGRCVALPQNCAQVDNNNRCISCLPGYGLSFGLCISSDSNCVRFNAQGRCQQCAANYFVNNQGRCQAYPSNCQNVDNAGACVSCISGYVLQGGLCYRLSANCNRYSVSTGFCEQCLPNFTLQGIQCQCLGNNQLIGGQCISLPENCLQIDNNLRCIRCALNFTLNANGFCVRNITPPNFCAVYNASTGICTECISTHILIPANNTCVPCGSNQVKVGNQCFNTITNCLNYTAQGQCSLCLSGFRLENGLCVPITPPNFCAVYNASTGICTQCLDNYVLRNNTCSLCPSGQIKVENQCFTIIVNCVNYTSQGQCLTCAPTYRLQNGLCVLVTPPNFCAVYNASTGICTECISTHILIPANNTCVPCGSNQVKVGNQCFNTIANCLNYTAQGQCSLCLSGFRLENGLCVQITPPNFCAVYNASTGICTQCLDNYILRNNTCSLCPSGQIKVGNQCFTIIVNCVNYTSQGQCLTCAPTYRLQNGLCVLVTPPNFCAVYNASTGICTECISTHILIPANNTCVPCGSNQVKVGNQCFNTIANCLNYTAQGQCSLCLSGFRLVNGSCLAIQPPRFCAVYNASTGICNQCLSGYTLSSNGLQCTLNNCLTMSSDGLTCTQCITNYLWRNGSCIFVTDFCLNYNNGLCTQCENGTLLNQSRCVPQFCSVYSYVNGVCSVCASGYQLINRKCYVQIPNCQTYTPTGSCSVCQSGFNLIAGNCVRII